VGLNYSVIEDCVNSPAGEALLYNYEQRTLKLYPNGIPFVPTITINNVRSEYPRFIILRAKIYFNFQKFDQAAQDAAQRDLKSVVCAYIPEAARPPQCV
jgi:hypothetical protein